MANVDKILRDDYPLGDARRYRSSDVLKEDLFEQADSESPGFKGAVERLIRDNNIRNQASDFEYTDPQRPEPEPNVGGEIGLGLRNNLLENPITTAGTHNLIGSVANASALLIQIDSLVTDTLSIDAYTRNSDLDITLTNVPIIATDHTHYYRVNVGSSSASFQSYRFSNNQRDVTKDISITKVQIETIVSSNSESLGSTDLNDLNVSGGVMGQTLYVLVSSRSDRGGSPISSSYVIPVTLETNAINSTDVIILPQRRLTRVLPTSIGLFFLLRTGNTGDNDSVFFREYDSTSIVTITGAGSLNNMAFHDNTIWVGGSYTISGSTENKSRAFDYNSTTEQFTENTNKEFDFALSREGAFVLNGTLYSKNSTTGRAYNLGTRDVHSDQTNEIIPSPFLPIANSYSLATNIGRFILEDIPSSGGSTGVSLPQGTTFEDWSSVRVINTNLGTSGSVFSEASIRDHLNSIGDTYTHNTVTYERTSATGISVSGYRLDDVHLCAYPSQRNIKFSFEAVDKFRVDHLPPNTEVRGIFIISTST